MKTIQILITLIFCGLVSSPIMGQNLYRNYITIKTMTTETDNIYSQDHILTRNYLDDKGRPEQTIRYGATPEGNDIVHKVEYDAAGREARQWLPIYTKSQYGYQINPEDYKKAAAIIYKSDNKPYTHLEYDESPLNRTVATFGPGELWYQARQPDSHTLSKIYTGSGEFQCERFTVECAAYDTSFTIKNILPYSANALQVKEIHSNGLKTIEFYNPAGLLLMQRQPVGKEQYADTYFLYDKKENLVAVLPPMAIEKLEPDASILIPVDSIGIDTAIIISKNQPVLQTTALTIPNQKLRSGSWKLAGSDVLNQYGYFYVYDSRRRCIAKKLPAQDWIYYVYDKYDQLIFMQDGELRKQNKWFFYLPDELGRTIVTGLCENQLAFDKDPLKNTYVYVRPSLLILEDELSPQGIELQGNIHYLSINYYDGKTFAGESKFQPISPIEVDSVITILPLNSSIQSGIPKGTLMKFTAEKKGLLTATRIYDTMDNENYIESEMEYDNRGRLIQTISWNSSGTDTIKSSLSWNFNSLLLQAKHTYIHRNHPVISEEYSYTYDHALRLTDTKYKLQIGEQTYPEIVLSKNLYNELEQLSTVILHGNPKLTNTYSYHIRSYLTKIQNHLFEQNLWYEESVGNSQGNYMGNISAMHWKSNGKNGGYIFDYDNLSRLTSATYTPTLATGNKSSYNSAYNSAYGVSIPVIDDKDHSTHYSYDLNGNILTLSQNNKSTEFYYKGNQLLSEGKVSADFPQHTYNTNGNLEKDYTKKIASIQYNPLNLPHKIQLINGHTIEYMYYADGSKKQVSYITAQEGLSIPYGEPRDLSGEEIASVRTVEYLGSLVFENNTLVRIHNEQGYITIQDGQPVYHYYLCDHQGNVRIVADHEGNVEEVNHYYPFGSLFESSTISVQPNKYSGKELETEFDLNEYDFSARRMNPDIGRFTTPDPMTEKYYSISPYAYCANNPINLVDPTGMDWYQNEKTKYYTWYEGNEEREGYTYIGGKGSVLGEFESIIDWLLTDPDIYNRESIYSDGFTFDIAPNDKGGLLASKERGWNFTDEFAFGVGPEFSVLLSDHPYTEAMKTEKKVLKGQQMIADGETNVPGQITGVARDWYPWNVFGTTSAAKQFIGSYRYDAFPSADGVSLNNVISDTKSRKSFFLRLPGVSNKNRSQTQDFGNTYQFYIWKSPKN